MRFNIDNIKEVLETYDLCLFFDSKEEKKIISFFKKLKNLLFGKTTNEA